MNIVSLDVHSEASQVFAVTDEGEILFESKLPTDPQMLRTIIGGIPGPKRVVFEEGPLSAMLTDALQDVADEIISCDPTRNPTIARDENSIDERDARNLATLARGERQLKRILFLAANAARRGDNALARRYQARIDAGWEHRKAIRDVARTLVCALCAIRNRDHVLSSSGQALRRP